MAGDERFGIHFRSKGHNPCDVFTYTGTLPQVKTSSSIYSLRMCMLPSSVITAIGPAVEKLPGAGGGGTHCPSVSWGGFTITYHQAGTDATK